MNQCKNCKWWGRAIVGANTTPQNKRRAICDNQDGPSCYDFYVHGVGWDAIIDFWTFEDFGCNSFKEKKK